jgi:hypothetical protein
MDSRLALRLLMIRGKAFMVVGGKKLLILAALSWALSNPISLYAFSGNLDFMLHLSSCSGCHSSATAPAPATAQAFRFKDIETETIVTQYQPGKTYEIEILFSPQLGLGANYRVAYFLKSKNSNGSALGEFTTPATITTPDGSQTAPDRIYKPQAHQVARVFSSTSRIAASALRLQWKAPESNEAARFEFARVESNNNGGNDAGDRGSSALEVVTIQSAGMPGDEGDEADPNRSRNFEKDLEGGCGTLRSTSNDAAGLWALYLTLMISVLISALRTSSRRRMKSQF